MLRTVRSALSKVGPAGGAPGDFWPRALGRKNKLRFSAPQSPGSRPAGPCTPHGKRKEGGREGSPSVCVVGVQGVTTGYVCTERRQRTNEQLVVSTDRCEGAPGSSRVFRPGSAGPSERSKGPPPPASHLAKVERTALCQIRCCRLELATLLRRHRLAELSSPDASATTGNRGRPHKDPLVPCRNRSSRIAPSLHALLAPFFVAALWPLRPCRLTCAVLQTPYRTECT